MYVVLVCRSPDDPITRFRACGADTPFRGFFVRVGRTFLRQAVVYGGVRVARTLLSAASLSIWVGHSCPTCPYAQPREGRPSLAQRFSAGLR